MSSVPPNPSPPPPWTPPPICNECQHSDPPVCGTCKPQGLPCYWCGRGPQIGESVGPIGVDVAKIDEPNLDQLRRSQADIEASRTRPIQDVIAELAAESVKRSQREAT